MPNLVLDSLRATAPVVLLALVLSVAGCDESAGVDSSKQAAATEQTASPQDRGPSKAPLPKVESARREPSDANSQPPAEAAAASAKSTPEQVAERWIEALIRKDVDALITQTGLPFTLHDPNVVKSECVHRAANNAVELRAAIACILDNKLLMDDLPEGRGDLTTLTTKSFPKWGMRWRKEVTAELTPVRQEVEGPGISHELILFVTANRVRALWRGAEFDPN